MSVPDREGDENEVEEGAYWETGASERRSCGFGAASPFSQLILVRVPNERLSPLVSGEHAGETGVSHAPLSGCPAERGARDRQVMYPRCGWFGHSPEKSRRVRAADGGEQHSPAVRPHLRGP